MPEQVKSELGPEVRISQPAVRYSVPSGRAAAEQGAASTQASLPHPAGRVLGTEPDGVLLGPCTRLASMDPALPTVEACAQAQRLPSTKVSNNLGDTAAVACLCLQKAWASVQFLLLSAGLLASRVRGRLLHGSQRRAPMLLSAGLKMTLSLCALLQASRYSPSKFANHS